MKTDNRDVYDVSNGVSEGYIVDLLDLDDRDNREVFNKYTSGYVLVSNEYFRSRAKKALIKDSELKEEKRYNLNLFLDIPEFKKFYNDNEIKEKFDIDFITGKARERFGIKVISNVSGLYYTQKTA